MKYVTHYQCTECNAEFSIEQPMNLCPHDGRPVQMQFDIAAIRKDYPRANWYHPAQSSMWRFGALLPFDVARQSSSICSLNEGSTPLLPVSDALLPPGLNAEVYLKEEGTRHQGYGCNPTGSFKDRGMAMVTTMAKYYGLDKLAIPTQGNAGDSLCEYAVNFGFDVAVIMPDDTPLPILGKVAAYSYLHAGVSLELVQGTIREAAQCMQQKYLRAGYFNCATFQEPGWRIEGKKTLGLEMAEPTDAHPHWRLPDVIIYPTGGGTGILGMCKAFDELEALGITDSHRPKIIAVQSVENAPVVDAIEQGLEDTIATGGGKTLAVGLNVPGGVGHKAVLRVLRQSGGTAIKVTEQAIAETMLRCFTKGRLTLSPEGAATIAALESADEQGFIAPGARVVCVNTGSAEKYWPDIKHIFNQ